MDKIGFGEWLAFERNKRGWSQGELARLSGVHRQSVNKIENTGTLPSTETFIALANALGLSPETLFRKAGLMPNVPSEQARLDDWKYLLSQLPPDEDDELRKIALLKIEKRQAAEAAARAAQFKPHEKSR